MHPPGAVLLEDVKPENLAYVHATVLRRDSAATDTLLYTTPS
jgi:hypothetical protein